jgi:hypothetical protein
MSATSAHARPHTEPVDDPILARKYPPVTELAMASLALIVIGGIYLSSHLPKAVPLGPAIGLLVASAALFGVNVYLLSRVRDFAWQRFFVVGRWSLLAYVIIGAMIEYAFVRNHVGGGALIVLTLSLAVFSVHVPTLVGFTVARYYDPEDAIATAAPPPDGPPA